MRIRVLEVVVRAGLSLALLGGLVVGVTGSAAALPLIRYVNAAASGGNGTSWANAYKSLGAALSSAVIGEQIWVAKGIYYPTVLTNALDPRSKTFKLRVGVAIYGGFAGGETLLTQRNPAVNVTTLSGSIGGPSIFDNAYHVVSAGPIGVDKTAVLDGFTITGGNASGSAPDSDGGGLFTSNSTPTLSNLVLIGNQAIFGGGMYCEFGVPYLTNVKFTKNTAQSGGGLLLQGSNAILKKVSFIGNVADHGGGLYNDGSSSSLTNVTFNANVATYEGGGMVSSGSNNGLLRNVVFKGNQAQQNDGGGMSNLGSAPALIHVSFIGNSAILGHGGGLANDTANPSLNMVTFSGNTAPGGGASGGAVYNSNGSTPAFTNTTFSGNSAAAAGGAMANNNASPVLSAVTFNGNTVTDGGGVGGAVYNTNNSNPSFTNATFSGNLAPSAGGGMDNYGSDPTLVNTTFTGNVGGGNGDAMANFNSSFPDISESIFWGDGTNEILFTDFSSSIITIRDSVVQGGQPVLSLTQNVIPYDPKLGLLQNNGGLTKTRALGAGRSAIDAGGMDGSCATKDQRGVLRPQGGACDLGAYEVHAQTFLSQGPNDGYVTETAKGSNLGGAVNTSGTSFLVGDTNTNRRPRGFLSFDSSPVPDTAAVVRAQVAVKQKDFSGNAFGTQGTLVADLARPFFGTGLGLLSGDWQVIPTVKAAGSFGTVQLLNGDWYTALLSPAGRAAVNKLGTTQFRLRFTNESYNAAPDNLSLFSGNDPLTGERPTLTVYYNP